MQSKSNQTLLIVLVAIFTFPIWIGLLGGLIGLVGGLFGGLMGMIGGLIGGLVSGLVSIVTLPFQIVFGDGWWPNFHFDGVAVLLVIIAVVLISKNKK